MEGRADPAPGRDYRRDLLRSRPPRPAVLYPGLARLPSRRDTLRALRRRPTAGCRPQRVEKPRRLGPSLFLGPGRGRILRVRHPAQGDRRPLPHHDRAPVLRFRLLRPAPELQFHVSYQSPRRSHSPRRLRPRLGLLFRPSSPSAPRSWPRPGCPGASPPRSAGAWRARARMGPREAKELRAAPLRPRRGRLARLFCGARLPERRRAGPSPPRRAAPPDHKTD